MDRAAGARDRMVGVAARYATRRVVRRESEGARARGRSLCVRSPPPAGVCRGSGTRARMGRDWTGLGCDANVSWIGAPRPGAPELAKLAGHHFGSEGSIRAFALGTACLDRRTVARNDEELWLLNFESLL